MVFALLILFMVFTFTFSPWWLLAVMVTPTDNEYLIAAFVAIVLAITLSLWWLISLLFLLIPLLYDNPEGDGGD